MPIRLAVPKETITNERRIALEPGVAKKLVDMGVKVMMQKGAALASHFSDEAFEGVDLVDDAASLYQQADVIFKVQPPTAGRAVANKRRCCNRRFHGGAQECGHDQSPCARRTLPAWRWSWCRASRARSLWTHFRHRLRWQATWVCSWARSWHPFSFRC